MSQRASLPFRSPLVLFLFFAGLVLPGAAVADARVSESYGKLPLHFEANQGQTHEDVRFLSRGPGYSLYLTAGEAVLVLTRPNPDGKPDGRGTPGRREAPAQAMPAVLRVSIVGAAPASLVSGREELPGKANYFVGSDPAKWRTNVATYAKVHYREVYPGIDLIYYGNQRQLEYDFVVAPGADPKKILLGFKGADRLEIDAQGDLVLHAPGGAIRQKKPVIYQEIDGVRQEVAGSYVRRGAKRVGFKLAKYDTGRPLIIDPVVLSYSTFLGGSDGDSASGIAVDAAGNAYVTGTTYSANFPTTLGAFNPTYTPSPFSFTTSDVFVTKFNPTGTALVYSTYLGGGGNDSGSGIAVDADGNAYVTGVAGNSANGSGNGESNFPTTPGAFQPTYGGGVHGGDAFVAKLNPTGSVLVYSTYLGGNSGEEGSGIAVDSAGNAYVTGNTYYVTGNTNFTNFPTTSGAFRPTYGNDTYVAFVTKVNPTGSALVYSTFLGGGGYEVGVGIAVDADGNAYVTGLTQSINFPTTTGAFRPAFGGGSGDAFVTKLNPEGSALVYSTYLGGGRFDVGNAIAVDAEGNAYATGYTRSADFPTTPGAFQPIFVGGPSNDRGEPDNDVFVTKVNPTGTALVYSTFLGGSGGDAAYGIAVDGGGNAYVTGPTAAIRESIDPGLCSRCINDFPTTPGSFQRSYGGGGADAFVAKLNPAGSAFVYSTYLGGSGGDSGRGIAVDASGNAYVTGWTGSINFPTTPGAFQPGGDSSDAFVAKMVDPSIRSEEGAATYTGPWTSYGPESGTFSGGSIFASNSTGATATFTFTGTAVAWIGVRCDICGIATVSIDGGLPTVVNTAGPSRPPNSLTSEPVFFASGLAPGVNHTMVITVTGTTTTSVPGLVDGHAQIAVDAFDVIPGGDAASPPLALSPSPVVPPPLPVLGL